MISEPAWYTVTPVSFQNMALSCISTLNYESAIVCKLSGRLISTLKEDSAMFRKLSCLSKASLVHRDAREDRLLPADLPDVFAVLLLFLRTALRSLYHESVGASEMDRIGSQSTLLFSLLVRVYIYPYFVVLLC